jgi:protein fantom
LKEANSKLVNSAFNADREREFREKERALKIQIAQLEATIRADLGERGNLLDRLTLEKGKIKILFFLAKIFF